MRLRPTLAVLLAILAGPAFAQAPTLEQLGFGVKPPPGYTVEPMAPDAGLDAQLGVRATAGGPKLPPGDVYTCRVGFIYQSSYAGYSQRAINDNLIGAKELTRARLAETFEIKSFGTFRQGEAEGIEMLGVLMAEPFAGQALVMVSILENPMGRVVVSCPGVVEEIDTAPAIFRSIRATVGLPRLP